MLANIRDVGPSVTVTVDGNIQGGQAIAEEFMDYAWRDFTTVKLLSVAEVVALAREGKAGDKPLVVADYTDNLGGGGYGDATAFLKGLVESGIDSTASDGIPPGKSGSHQTHRWRERDSNRRSPLARSCHD